MMHKVTLVKRLKGLYPTDEYAEETLRSIGQGEIVAVTIVRPRNVQFHRKFFAMLQIILANQSYYKSMGDLLDICKLSIGHYRTVMTQQGLVKLPKSISFASMDDVEFADFYRKACDWICSEVIPGLRQQDLDAEVEAELMEFATS